MRGIVLWLAGCVAEGELVMGPPVEIEVSPLVPGHTVVVEAFDWPVVGSARLLVSTRAGQGPCTPGGPCLGLRSPVLLASGATDPSGHLRLEGRVPSTVPPGARVHLQVAQLDPAAPGGVSALSPVLSAVVEDDPLAAESDDFERSATLADWTLLSDVEGPPVLHDRVDIDVAEPGALVIEPNRYDDPTLGDGGAGPGWFQDRKGPLLYREITGDFAARVHVRVGRRDGIHLRPDGAFQAAGFVLRDPSSIAPRGDERWLMFNLGWQFQAMATELKTTFPDGPDADDESQSTLMLDPVGVQAATLVACRVGDHFRFWRRLDGEGGWTEQVPDPALVYADNAGVAYPDFATDGFVRPDLPATLQVGLMVGMWEEGAAPPVRGAFDEVWFGTPADEADCTRAPVPP